MFSRLKSLFGAPPSEKVDAAPSVAPTSEWSSLSLDPEMTPFGAARQDSDDGMKALDATEVPSALVTPEPAESLMRFELLAEDDAAPAQADAAAALPMDAIASGEDARNALNVEATQEAPDAPGVLAAVDAPVSTPEKPAKAAKAKSQKSPAAKRAPKNAAKVPTKGRANGAAKKSPVIRAPRAKEPAPKGRISGTSLTKGPWQMPGVDGWMGAPLNNHVDFVNIEDIALQSAER